MNGRGKLNFEIGILGIMWGTTFVATTSVLDVLSIGQYLALRWGIAGITSIIFVALNLVKVEFRRKNLKPLIVIMLLQPCVYATLETIGLNMTTASEASIILALMPITIALITTLILRERLKKNITIAAIICIIGVLFTVMFEKDFELSGKLLGYGVLYACVLSGAAYTLIGNKMGGQYTPVEITIALSVGGGIFFTASSIVKGEFISGIVLAGANIGTVLLLIYLGVFCSLICFFLYNDINSKLIPAKTSLFVENIVTLVGVISAVIINNDSMSLFKGFGVILLVVGIAYLSLSEEKENRLNKRQVKDGER